MGISTIEESIAKMEEVVGRSHGLWQPINQHILNVLRSGKTPDEMALELRRIAGRKKKGEPVCLGNLRTAARQIKAGKLVSVL